MIKEPIRQFGEDMNMVLPIEHVTVVIDVEEYLEVFIARFGFLVIGATPRLLFS